MKLHGWVIVAVNAGKLVSPYNSRKNIREFKRHYFPERGFAIRPVEVIEPAPRKKKPVLMICPKATECKIGYPVFHCPSKVKHKHNLKCDFSNATCPKCVEAR